MLFVVLRTFETERSVHPFAEGDEVRCRFSANKRHLTTIFANDARKKCSAADGGVDAEGTDPPHSPACVRLVNTVGA